MATIDEFYAAQKQLAGTRAELNAIAQRLTILADKLRDPGGVRLTVRPTYTDASHGPPSQYLLIDRDDLVSWERVEMAVRAFANADAAFRQIESSLTPEQRQQVNQGS